MRVIDINVDIAEGFAFDDALMHIATSVNVCCGIHAGNLGLTLATIEYAMSRGLRVGLHPGYPDRESMGRRGITPETTNAYLTSIYDQVNQVLRHAPAAYIKPHGAFYSDTGFILPPHWDKPAFGYFPGQDPAAAFLNRHPGANALSMLLRTKRLPLMGLHATSHPILAQRAGQGFVSEGFADRRYAADGTLKPRSEPDSVLTDIGEIRDHVVALAARVDTICIHGDTPGCVEIAELVATTLADNGYAVASL